MIKLLAMILALAVAQITPVTSDVIAGGETTVQIVADFPEEIHGLVMFVDYAPEALEALEISHGGMEFPEHVIYSMDCSTPGRCRIGLICPAEGLSGSGVLANIRFSVSNSCETDQPISISISECYSMPLGGEYNRVDCEVASGYIHIINPSAENALTAFRAALNMASAPEWADANNDGEVRADDALLILRWTLRK